MSKTPSVEKFNRQEAEQYIGFLVLIIGLAVGCLGINNLLEMSGLTISECASVSDWVGLVLLKFYLSVTVGSMGYVAAWLKLKKFFEPGIAPITCSRWFVLMSGPTRSVGFQLLSRLERPPRPIFCPHSMSNSF